MMYPDDDEIPPDDELEADELFEEAWTPVRAIDVPVEAFPDEPTAKVHDPCPMCGAPIARVKDTERAPVNAEDASLRHLVCAASRDGRWTWCQQTRTLERK